MKVKDFLTEFNKLVVKSGTKKIYDSFTLNMVFHDIIYSLSPKEKQNFKGILIEISEKLKEIDKKKQKKLDDMFEKYEPTLKNSENNGV